MHESPDYAAINRGNLARLLARGCKQTRTLGLELEHILLRKQTGAQVGYSEPGGVRDVLNKLAPFYEKQLLDGEDLIGLENPGESVTLEPAGQLEISVGPFDTVTEIERAYLAFRDKLDPILDEFDVETPMLGYNPSAKANELELIPKYRYECMTRFLQEQSDSGVRMMRATASLQVSIDYRNEADALRKLRVAQAIAPILALICDNSPVFEGAPRPHQMMRTAVWSDMRQDRVGTIPGSLDAEFSFLDYADYLLSREAILVLDSDAPGGWRFVGAQTFDEAYAEHEMSDDELMHALSMVWPDARLKGFVEIRPADAMPFEYCLAYAVLIRALFYDDRNLDLLDSLLANVDERAIDEAKSSLMDQGYGGCAYGRPCEFWVDLLMTLASGSLEPGEWLYLEPITSMARHRFTLAEIWPRLMEKRFRMPPGAPDAPIIGVVPRYDFEWAGLAIGDGYLTSLLASGAVPVVLPTTSDPAYISLLVQACDGFLIPGGQDIDPSCYGARREPCTHRSATARDAMEQALVPAVIKAGKPLLGICRGMQAINVALGGTLRQNIESDDSGNPLRHVQSRPFDHPAHAVDIAPGSQLAEIVGERRLCVNTIHHQCVKDLGPDLVVSALSSHDGIIEGIELEGNSFVVGVQWHPEHMLHTYAHAKKLFRAFVDAARAR